MSRRIFSNDFAERMKARAGEPYRPANGAEGDYFEGAFCERCEKDRDEDCPVHLNALIYETGDPGYPREWQVGPDGQPLCTAFEARGAEPEWKPPARKPLAGQGNLFREDD